MRIGILVFDKMTLLDAVGPFEALSSMPGATVILIAKRRRVVTAGGGFALLPHVDLAHCPKLDIVCIPGGRGIDALLLDDAVLKFVRRQARTARYVTSVCTGSLVLGAAGLLRGRRAACHWMSLHLLKSFGAKPSARRIERDGKFITAGGVTSGIDFGLSLAAKIVGVSIAKNIQLMMQYDPQPPFRAGTPVQAGKRMTDRIIAQCEPVIAARTALVARAAARLKNS